MKERVQKSFQQGDFKSSAALGEEALESVKKLPANIAIVELIHLHMNLASSYMELKDFFKSEEHCNQAVKHAELASRHNPNHPPSIELLSMALGTRCLLMLHTERLDQASESAAQSHKLAETIYSKTDPRLVKSLKITALVQVPPFDRSGTTPSLLPSLPVLQGATGTHDGGGAQPLPLLHNPLSH